MNDNNNYDDELFEENMTAEQDGEQPANKNPGKMRIVIVAVIVALVAVIILVSMLLNSKKTDNDTQDKINENVISSTEAESGNQSSEELTTVVSVEDNYAPGKYTVNVGANGTLTLRKGASKTSESILSIPNGTLLTITEVAVDTASDDDLKYWGKTVYLGWEAWVSMNYLAKAYSDNVVTPAEVTTAAPASENTTTAEPESKEESTSSQQSNDNVYTVSVDDGLTLNMRSEPNADSEKVHDSGIPSGTKVTVLDTYENTEAVDSNVKVWAKVTYDGVTGWVAMGYLKK